MIKAVDIDRVIAGHTAVMDAYDPKRRIGLVCDEWGTWWKTEPGTNPRFLHQQNTLRDALVAGVHFDIFHKHAARLHMANIAQTVNVLQSMILTDDDGGMVLTPTYHVFEMNKGHHDALQLPVHLIERPDTYDMDGAQLDLISISASTKDGSALISASNLALDSDTTLTLDLRGQTVTGHQARVLTADNPQSHNTTGDPHSVAPTDLDLTIAGGVLTVTLPRHSFSTIHLDLA
jgi:alpha-L-arabinofuranosidase